MNVFCKAKIVFASLLCLNSFSLLAQVSPTDALYQEIMTYDSMLFEAGFNNCNIETLYQITSHDFEFYHDQSGLLEGRESFVEGTRKNICSINYRPERRLKEGSTEIYPLKNNSKLYGVIQKGVHEFFAREEDKEPYLTSTAQFSHLWIKKEDKWLLRSVQSFDHQVPEEAAAAKQEGLFEKTEAIENWIAENKVPALGVALIKEGKLSNVNVYGNLYGDTPAPYNTLFNVASLTKPIVSMLTLKLVENGDWDLDEPLFHYWVDPDVQNDPNRKRLTSRHVLSHQTGFKNWRIDKLTFDFEPGTSFRYSGEGFEYLKMALENKFEKSLENLADSLLFTPLGMEDTRFIWSKEVDESRFAKWHDAEGKNSYPIFKQYKASAADNLLTTVEDYGRFAAYVLNGGGISEDLFQQMVSQQNGEENRIKMGLGWEILPNLKNDEYAILHSGSDIGVNTLLILLPKTGEGIVIFTNGDNGKNLYFQLIERLSVGKQIIGKA